MQPTDTMETEKKRIDRKNGFRSHLKFVLIFYLLGFGIVYCVYLISPKYYKASASILQPPERELNVSKETSDSSEKSISQFRTNTELFFSILNSRTIKDDIIVKFGLVKEYNARNIDHARERLDKRVNLYLTKQKIIEISVIDTNPQRAADMANYFIERLDNTIKAISITTAKQDRIFIEARLHDTEQTIDSLEKKLAGIKDRDKLVADKDLAQITQTAGRLMEELFNKKLEMQRKGEVLKANSFEMELLKKDIQNLETTLSRLLYSENELTGIIRELRAQEEIYSFLTSKLEEAKIDEARDTPVIQVLDEAVVPCKIYKPNIKLLLIIQAVVFGGLSILIFFFDLLRYLGNI